MGRGDHGRGVPLLVLLAVVAVAVATAGIWAAITLRGDEDGDGAGPASPTGTEASSTDTSSSTADAKAFERAIDSAGPGTTIRLQEGSYESLEVEGKEFSAPVRIVGSAATTVGEIRVEDSRNVAFEGFVVAPATTETEAVVSVKDSEDVSFLRIRFDGRSERQGVRLKVHRDSVGVSVVESDFTKCRSYCVQPGGDSIEILRSRFHDLSESDAVKGGGSDVTVADSTFDRAVPGEAHSHHNDFIQVMGGGPWLIARNRFGHRKFGAAQIYVNAGSGKEEGELIEDVQIVSNLFTGDMAFAIRIGGDTARVSIVNNTILSGHMSGIRFADSLASLPESERPLVANNVIAVASERLCEGARTEANVFLKGAACSPTDRTAELQFDESGQPTSSLELLVDAADPDYAPETDLRGRRRDDSPDIGALELQK